MLPPLQVTVIVTLSFVLIQAVPPPGYVKPKSEPDESPPRYEYGYKIQDEKGAAQGKSESRDGIYATGRYYVEEENSNKSVKYYADDWGFHPYVEYESSGPHSHSSTQLVLGTEAIKKFRDGKAAASPREEVNQSLDDINKRQQIQIKNQKPSGSIDPTPSPGTVNTQFPTDPGTLPTTQAVQPDVIDSQLRAIISEVLGSPQARQRPDVVDNSPQSTQEKSSDVADSTNDSEVNAQQQNVAETPLSTPSVEAVTNEQTLGVTLQPFQEQQQFFTDRTVTNLDAQNIFTQQTDYIGPAYETVSTNEPQQVTTLDLSRPVERNYVIQFNQGHASGNQDAPQQESNIFAKERISTSENSEQSSQEVSDSYLEHQYVGSFGSRLGVQQSQKSQVTPPYVQITRYQIPTQQQVKFRLQSVTPSYIQQNTVYQPSSKLIETTKNLINGQDVLNINGVIGGAIENHSVASSQTKITETKQTSQYHQQTSNSAAVLTKVVNNSDIENIIFTTAAPAKYTNIEFAENPSNLGEYGGSTIKESTSKTEFVSTTAHSAEKGISYAVTEPSTVLVTPRPGGTNFLAPINAGVQLQSIEYNTDTKSHSDNRHAYAVDIQQSIPYYLGKFEYPSGYEKEQSKFEEDSSQESKAKQSAVEHIELSKTLLYFPGGSTRHASQVETHKEGFKHEENAKYSFAGKTTTRGEIVKQHIPHQVDNVNGDKGSFEQQLPSTKENKSFSKITHSVTIQHSPSSETTNDQVITNKEKQASETTQEQQKSSGYDAEIDVRAGDLEQKLPSQEKPNDFAKFTHLVTIHQSPSIEIKENQITKSQHGYQNQESNSEQHQEQFSDYRETTNFGEDSEQRLPVVEENKKNAFNPHVLIQSSPSTDIKADEKGEPEIENQDYQYQITNFGQQQLPSIHGHVASIEDNTFELPTLAENNKFAKFTHLVSIHQSPSIEYLNGQQVADQVPAQGYQYQVSVPNFPTEKPVEVTNVNEEKPYPPQVPVHIKVPYSVEKEVPVTVEKPIAATQIIENPVPVPQSYPVEKIIERPIHIPIEVPTYIDRPYPVEVPVPHPVPYPVEKIVRQPYPVHVPVEVKVPVEKIVEKPIHIPQYIDRPVPVTKIVEKPVVQYVDRPYPVEVKVPVHAPQTYVLPLELPKPYPVELPKPIQNHQPPNNEQQYFIAQTFTNQAPYIKSQVQPQLETQNAFSKYVERPTQLVNVQQQQYHQKQHHKQQAQQIHFQQVKQRFQQGPQQALYNHRQQQQQQGYFYPNPYAPTHVKAYLPAKTKEQSSNGYLPPKRDQHLSGSYRNLYFSLNPDEYIGLLPPRVPNELRNFATNFRKARSNFNNLRIEYGFMPPLIPSLEIDENGKPIEKNEE